MDALGAVTNFVSLVVAIAALALGILNRRADDRRELQADEKERQLHRETQIRRGEVLLWVDEAIAALQTLTLVSDEILRGLKSPARDPDEMRLLSRKLSILAERGRVFFKNVDTPFGQEKDPAYRGLRPEILDQLVIAFSIARNWDAAPEMTRRKLRFLALRCTRQFISLAQLEVGRSQVASADASRAGRGRQLAVRLEEVDEQAMREWERDFGTMA